MKKDFAAIFIWSMFGLSAVGAGTHFWLQSRIDDAKTNNPRALRALAEIRRAEQDILVLNQEKSADEFRKSEERYNEYFEKMASEAALPGPDIEKPRDDTPASAKGYQDKTYELTWRRNKKVDGGFSRQQIAHFFYNIESQTKLLKISEIDLRNTDLKQNNDSWELKVAVTARKATGGQGDATTP